MKQNILNIPDIRKQRTPQKRRRAPLFIYFPIYLSIYLSIYLFIYFPIYLSIYFSTYPLLPLFIPVFIFLFIGSFVWGHLIPLDQDIYMASL